MIFGNRLKQQYAGILASLVYSGIKSKFSDWNREMLELFPAIQLFGEDHIMFIYMVAGIYTFIDTFKEDVDINHKDKKLIIEEIFELGEKLTPGFKHKIIECEAEVDSIEIYSGGHFSSVENREKYVNSLSSWIFKGFRSLNPTFAVDNIWHLNILGEKTIYKVLEYWKENCKFIIDMYFQSLNLKF